MKFIAAVALVLLIGVVSTQVIGIDLGTEFWKAALISPGKNLVIVENSRSGRKSHNGVEVMLGRSHSWMESGTSNMMLLSSIRRSPSLLTSILTN